MMASLFLLTRKALRIYKSSSMPDRLINANFRNQWNLKREKKIHSIHNVPRSECSNSACMNMSQPLNLRSGMNLATISQISNQSLGSSPFRSTLLGCEVDLSNGRLLLYIRVRNRRGHTYHGEARNESKNGLYKIYAHNAFLGEEGKGFLGGDNSLSGLAYFQDIHEGSQAGSFLLSNIVIYQRTTRAF